jgi:enoyl-[acyl-carrier protein] reductase II
MAGQSVGMVAREQPVREILDELVGQAVATLAARGPSPGGVGAIAGDRSQAGA